MSRRSRFVIRHAASDYSRSPPGLDRWTVAARPLDPQSRWTAAHHTIAHRPADDLPLIVMIAAAAVMIRPQVPVHLQIFVAGGRLQFVRMSQAMNTTVHLCPTELQGHARPTIAHTSLHIRPTKLAINNLTQELAK